ncbi:MAG: TonB-dependent receptor [Bacteroidales bacterium]|nr:TonB-dependent receptor [Bacteroidales bacterium]
MIKYTSMLFMGMFCAIVLHAQTIKVTDKTNLQGLANVAIYDAHFGATVITNAKGMADFSAFAGSDSIWFTHVSYLPLLSSYSALKAAKFVISMTEKAFPLDEVVVSASRFEEKRRDVAQPIQVIKSKELAFINQQTTAEVMQNTGNVFVQKSQLGGGSPIIRGFETNKVLMVVDGVRMNNAIYRGGHLQNIITIDNAMLDKVEIVYGPGSVVYGSDALGGVMHFYSKSPVFSEEGVLVKADAFVRLSTAYAENTEHVDFSIGGKRFASLTSFTRSDFGDLRQGGNRNPFYGDWGKRPWFAGRINDRDTMLTNSNVNIQKQSGYTQYDLQQKFMLRQSAGVMHTLNLQFSTSSDIPRYDRLTLSQGNNPKYAQWYYGPQERLFASYLLKINNNTAMYDHARFITGYQHIVESRHDRKFNSSNLNHRTEKLDIITFNADFDKKLGRNEIRYGLDGWYNKVNSSAFSDNLSTGASTSIDTRYPDGGSDMQSLALYITHAWEINEHLVLNDGVRLNNVRLNAQFNDTTFFPFPFKDVLQNNTALNGMIGLVYMPGDEWRISLIGSTGFRAPNVDDLSKVFESIPGSVIVPNPNLEPEYTYNTEVGISKAFNEKITLGANAYYTWYKHAITTKPGLFNGQDSVMFSGQLSRVLTNVNAAEAYIYGMTSYLNAEITDNFSISSTLNYTYGRIKTDSSDYPLDHIPPMFGKTSLNLKMSKFQGEFFVAYNAAKLAADYNLFGEDNASYSADPVNGYMPAWMTLNLRTAYQFNKYIQLQLALENILDQNYRVFASNIGAPGRNFIVTLKGTF